MTGSLVLICIGIWVVLAVVLGVFANARSGQITRRGK